MHNKTPDYRHPRLHINWPYLSHIWIGKCIRLMDTSDPRQFGTETLWPHADVSGHFSTKTFSY